MKQSLALLMSATIGLIGSVVAHATILVEPTHERDQVILSDQLPTLLSEFQFFDDAAGRDPADRVIAYELNTPLFSDGADKLRYVYVPANSTIGSDGEGLLQFPVGSAIIKTFAFGEREEQRFIETRVLLHRADGWVALPYRWNAEQTEARLAIAGARIPITTPQGDEISYRIPNMNQCKTCHSQDSEIIPIGPKARNLSADWLSEMVDGEHLTAMPEGADVLPVWQAADTDGEIDAQARAYLDVNCAHCHKPGGSASNTGLDLRWEQNDPFAIGVRKPPVAAGRGAGGFLVSIEPGNPDTSILVHRMNSTEPGVAMPELGRSTIDHDAVALMRTWIEGMSE